MIKKASAKLEAWVDESIRLSNARGYHPSQFIRERARIGTWLAMHNLVISGELQTGFRRMLKIGLKDWTLEAGVLEFPKEFPRTAQACAHFRLNVLAAKIKEART